MNNSNGRYQKALSFSSFFSGGGADDEVPVLKKAVMRVLSKETRPIAFSPRATHREEARPVIEPSIVSRYKVDDYGRPRILSKAEIIIHDVARWTVIAVVIGYGLAISIVVIHNSSVRQPQQKTTQAQQFASQEIEP